MQHNLKHKEKEVVLKASLAGQDTSLEHQREKQEPPAGVESKYK